MKRTDSDSHFPGHNFADAERRVEIQQLYERRMALLAWVRRFGPIPLPPSPPSSD